MPVFSDFFCHVRDQATTIPLASMYGLSSDSNNHKLSLSSSNVVAENGGLYHRQNAASPTAKSEASSSDPSVSDSRAVASPSVLVDLVQSCAATGYHPFPRVSRILEARPSLFRCVTCGTAHDDLLPDCA